MSEQKKIETLAAAADFYGKSVGDGAIALWLDALDGYTAEQVHAALKRHMQDPENGRFMPTPAHLMKYLAGSSTDKAAEAWGKAYQAAKTVGAYEDVVFDDAAIHAAISDLGGWPSFCRVETSELSYQQHRFTQAYQAYTHKDRFEYPRKLAGDRSPDDFYIAKGLPLPTPHAVGNAPLARLVYKNGDAGGGGLAKLAKAAKLALGA